MRYIVGNFRGIVLRDSFIYGSKSENIYKCRNSVYPVLFNNYLHINI